jgi:hypothetical protein
MKRQIKRKALVATITALCVWSSQASAIDAKDGIFNCHVYSQGPGSVTRYYLRVKPSTVAGATLGSLQYTTNIALATRFAFTRKDTWKHDTTGTSYYMTGGPGGGCVGLPSSGTADVGTVVQWNYKCSDHPSKKVLVDYYDNHNLILGVESAKRFYFNGWGGLASGNSIRLNTAPSVHQANQRFLTSGCRASDGGGHRPKVGTDKQFPR